MSGTPICVSSTSHRVILCEDRPAEETRDTGALESPGVGSGPDLAESGSRLRRLTREIARAGTSTLPLPPFGAPADSDLEAHVGRREIHVSGFRVAEETYAHVRSGTEIVERGTSPERDRRFVLVRVEDGAHPERSGTFLVPVSSSRVERDARLVMNSRDIRVHEAS